MKSKRGEWDKIVVDELGKRIVGNIEQREIVFAFMLGKLVKNVKPSSFNLLLKCASSSGKDWIVKNVGDLFLEEEVEYWGRLTPKALNYIHNTTEEPEFTYDGKVIYLEEITEGTLNDEVMKVLTSGKSKIVSVIRGKAIIKEVKGKPSIIATSMSSIPAEEILNRFAIIELDLSEKQRKAVLRQRGKVGQRGEESIISKKVIKELSELKRYSVRIPYANKIVKHFPGKRMSETRLIDRFLDLIKVITAFYQEERSGQGGEMLIAEKLDYEIARCIFENIPFGFPDFLLSDIQNKVVEFLRKQKQPLEASEILHRLGEPLSIQNFRPHLKRLVDLRKLEAIPLWNERNYNVDKYQIIEESDNPKYIKLPHFEEL